MTTKKSKTTKRAPVPKPIDQVTLTLTTEEVEHLRDLFSVLLPPNGEATVSEFLAAIKGKGPQENELFDKIEELCDKVGLPTGDQAPDYVVMTVGAPTMGVFLANVEEAEEADESSEPG